MQPQRPKRVLKTSPFIVKLAKILDDSEYSSLISWTPCEAAFIVHQPYEFSSTLLPKYFRHSNYGSFLRQLNFYSFVKVKSHDDSIHQFKHPLFLKGEHDKYRLIKREKAISNLDSGSLENEQVSSEDVGQDENIAEKPLNQQIDFLKRSQAKLLQNCRQMLQENKQTIEWGFIKSAEAQNEASHNQVICNRLFDLIDRHPHLAEQFSYFDSDVINNLLNLLEESIPTVYPPLVQKFFGIVENKEIWDVVDMLNTAVVKGEQKKRKSFTIVSQRQRRIIYEKEQRKINPLPPSEPTIE